MMSLPALSDVRLAGGALAGVLAAVLAGSGCEGFVLTRSVDDAGTGAFGAEGRAGVLQLETALRVRGDRSVDVDVFLPTDDDATPRSDAPPAVVVAGGAVPATRYAWLGEHLASRGFAVVVPRFLFDLAFFDQADVPDALSGLLRRSASTDNDLLQGTVDVQAEALVVGHSLGGVVAATTFDRDPRFGSLVLLASYPDPGSPPTRNDGAALSVVGALDGSVDFDNLKAGALALKVPTTTAIVDDLTHFQFTDDATDAELEKEGTQSAIAADEARRPALFLIDAFAAAHHGLDADALPGGADVLRDDATWPDRLHRLDVGGGT